jgi:hypothetical protein
VKFLLYKVQFITFPKCHHSSKSIHEKFIGLDLRKELESNKVLKAVGIVPKNGFSQKALYRLFFSCGRGPQHIPTEISYVCFHEELSI